MANQLFISNPEIISFFDKYPSLDFEKVVLMTIRNLESIIEKLDVNELNQTMTIQLFNSINKIQHQLTNINETINKSQLDNYNKSIVQLIEFKKDFTNDIQNIIINFN